MNRTITTENIESPRYARLGQAATVFAIIGAIGLAAGYFTMRGDAPHLKLLMQSYLYGWVLAMLLALGCYGFMLLHYMTRGRADPLSGCSKPAQRRCRSCSCCTFRS